MACVWNQSSAMNLGTSSSLQSHTVEPGGTGSAGGDGERDRAGTSSSSRQDEGRELGCLAEELADARLLSRSETLAVIESLTEGFLEAISRGEDPELHLVWRELPNYDPVGTKHIG